MLDYDKLIKRWIALSIVIAVSIGIFVGLAIIGAGKDQPLRGVILACMLVVTLLSPFPLIFIAKSLMQHYREKNKQMTVAQKSAKEKRKKVWIKIGTGLLLAFALFCVVFGVIHLITLDEINFGAKILYSLWCILISFIFLFTEGQAGGPGELWQEVFTGWGLIVLIICFLLLTGVLKIKKPNERQKSGLIEINKFEDDEIINEPTDTEK